MCPWSGFPRSPPGGICHGADRSLQQSPGGGPSLGLVFYRQSAFLRILGNSQNPKIGICGSAVPSRHFKGLLLF